MNINCIFSLFLKFPFVYFFVFLIYFLFPFCCLLKKIISLVRFSLFCLSICLYSFYVSVNQFIYLFIFYQSISSFIYSLTDLLSYSLIYSLSYAFIYSSIHTFISLLMQQLPVKIHHTNPRLQ